MTLSLPTSPDAFATGDWSQILPYYEDLAGRPLDDIAHWLHDWSALEKLVGEAYGLAIVAYTTDTSDEEKERRHLRWSSEIAPKAEEQQVRLARRLVASGYTEPDLEVTIRGFRNQIALFREESLPLQGEVAKESSAYQRVTGQMLVDWDGETLPVPRVEAKLEETDRALRERAYRAATAPYIAARSDLAGIFDRLYAARQQIARQAGFANFRDYQHRSLNRFDYTPDDCLRWHEAVEEVAVPAIARIRERRRAQLGVDRLRPWDVAVDPLGRPPLRPFQEAGELIAGVGRMFAGLDPDLGRSFAALAEGRLLDLDSRPGKAPGGYCLNLPERGSAFIFMNAAGTQQDVFTLLHESGHSFHAFAGAHLPLYWEGECGSEIAEVASMSMELLAGPRLGVADGGFYDDEASVRRARAENLSSAILGLAHIACVDAFQHWIYTDPDGADAGARDRQWLELRQRFERGIDFEGLTAQRVARWYRQLHLFEVPFYYIEYGLAQLGALQVWRNSLRDAPAALAAYRSMLALGNTRPLPELYHAAGARLVFDAPTMRELVDLAEQELDRLER